MWCFGPQWVTIWTGEAHCCTPYFFHSGHTNDKLQNIKAPLNYFIPKGVGGWDGGLRKSAHPIRLHQQCGPALLYSRGWNISSERFSFSRNLFKLSDDLIKSSRWCVRGGWGLMGKQSCGGQNIIGEWKGNDMGQLLWWNSGGLRFLRPQH